MILHPASLFFFQRRYESMNAEILEKYPNGLGG